MSSTHTLPVNIFNLEGGEIILARNNENFRTPGENWTHAPPNTTCLSDVPSTDPEGRELDSCLEAWKLPLSRASMVSPPSKMKMFTGNVCVLLTSVSLKLSFRSPAEKKNKQTGTNKQTLFGNYLNAINRPGFWCFSDK